MQPDGAVDVEIPPARRLPFGDGEHPIAGAGPPLDGVLRLPPGILVEQPPALVSRTISADVAGRGGRGLNPYHPVSYVSTLQRSCLGIAQA